MKHPPQSGTGHRTRWHWPLVLPVTASIVVAPAALASVIVPAGDPASIAISAVVAVAISLALASAEAALWKRWRGSRDCVFADLLVWGCARRWWAERRLRDVRGSYEAAVEAGAPIRIELLEGLCRLLAARHAYTHGHCRRVARHAERIARALGLTEAEVARIRTAAVLHDLGKVYTPTAILDKPGRLTDEEFAVVVQHPVDGADMLRSVRDPELAAIVRHHHERLDGSGYPDGLAGEAIPLGARIVAVADTFDALTSNRPYRRAHGHRRGLEVLAGMAGTQLDARAVAAFAEQYSGRRPGASLAFLTAIGSRVAAPLGLTSGGVGAGGVSLGQLAPALGAAGLLALAPAGAHGGGVTLRASPTALVRGTRPSPAGVGVSLPARAQVNGAGRSPRRHRGGAHAPRHSSAPASPDGRVRAPALPPSRDGERRLAGSPPPVASPPSSTAGSSAGAPPSGASTPPPSAGSPPPPPTGSPPPSPPPTPPTTVTVPEVSVPPVSLPIVTTPEVKVPRVEVSTGLVAGALAVSVSG